MGIFRPFVPPWAHPPGSEVLLSGSEVLIDCQDRLTDGWKISPFYRTSSPTGAAAQKGQGKGTADHLMLLVFSVFLSLSFSLMDE